MIWLAQIAQKWLVYYSIHLLEIWFFTLVILWIDRCFKLSSTTRYHLWLVALCKAFLPITAVLTSSGLLVLPCSEVPISTFNTTQQIESGIAGLAKILFVFWILIIVSTGILMGIERISLKRKLATSKSLDITIPRYLCNNPVRLYENACINAPVLFGLTHPRVYLPLEWHSWSGDELKCILSYELGFIKRRDHFVVALQNTSLLLFGFTPVIWLITQSLNRYRREMRGPLNW